MKYICAFIGLLFFYTPLPAQKYMTRMGQISFFSNTPIEDIEAINNEVSAIIDIENGNAVYEVPIKSFRFEKALMQQHFNEKYMESDRYPIAKFTGHLTNFNDIDFKKNGTYPAIMAGKLTLHGVTKFVQTKGTLTVQDSVLTTQCIFTLALKDYNIDIPKLVIKKIAKEIEVTVNCPLKKI